MQEKEEFAFFYSTILNSLNSTSLDWLILEMFSRFGDESVRFVEIQHSSLGALRQTFTHSRPLLKEELLRHVLDRLIGSHASCHGHDREQLCFDGSC